MEKAWLSDKGIEYTERNIIDDSSALAELQEMNVFSTPVAIIDGERVIGFDRDKLSELLDL